MVTQALAQQHADYCRLPWGGRCTCADGSSFDAAERSVSEANSDGQRGSGSVSDPCWRCDGHQRVAVLEPGDGQFTWQPCPECC